MPHIGDQSWYGITGTGLVRVACTDAVGLATGPRRLLPYAGDPKATGKPGPRSRAIRAPYGAPLLGSTGGSYRWLRHAYRTKRTNEKIPGTYRCPVTPASPRDWVRFGSYLSPVGLTGSGSSCSLLVLPSCTQSGDIHLHPCDRVIPVGEVHYDLSVHQFVTDDHVLAVMPMVHLMG